MGRKRAKMSWILYVISLLGLCACAAAYSLMRSGSEVLGETDRESVLALLGVGAIAATCEFFSRGLIGFRIALGIRIAAFLAAMALVAGARPVEILLLCGLIAETAVYEPFPQNIVIGSGVVLASLGIRQAAFMAGRHLALGEALFGQIDFLFLGFFLVASTGLASRYREELICVAREKKRLDETAVKLTRLNLQYQDFAASAAEAAMEDERKRITRDIHDVVGYTLTNNIAMMEAATDMMRRNPFGVPALIHTARENAQEGLDLIRDALYRLRRSEVQMPSGLRAVTRMCRIFERATGVRVRLELGNAAWSYGDAMDSALYHLVQEALINSFRHGRARTVTVQMAEQDGTVLASIGDDGRGAAVFREGIGLRGMRERIEALDGGLSFDGVHGGFTVLARIPGKG